jgi:hypothetical protein
VIRNSDRGHAAPGCFGRQFTDFAGAVEKRVIRVQMQVDEVLGSHAENILDQVGVFGYAQSNEKLSRGFSPLLHLIRSTLARSAAS